MAGFEPAVTLYKNDTTVTPTTALQTKTNPPEGGYLYGGRSETRTQETREGLAVFETAAIAAMRTFQNNCDSGPLLLSTLRSHK